MQHMMAVDNLSFIVKRRGGPIVFDELTKASTYHCVYHFAA